MIIGAVLGTSGFCNTSIGINAPVIGWNAVWYSPFLVKSDEMVDPGIPPDIAIMSFEDALAELEQIVRRLEGGQVKLERLHPERLVLSAWQRAPPDPRPAPHPGPRGT